MIVATRPEPTVRPPSRFVGSKIMVFFYIFSMDFYSYYSIFHLVFMVLKFFRTKIEPLSLFSVFNVHKKGFPISRKALILLALWTITRNYSMIVATLPEWVLLFMHYHALSLKLACLLGSHSCTVMYRYALLRPNSLQNCCKIAFLLQTAVNPLPGLFPRKPLNSLIDFPLILFSLLLLLLRKYPL